MKRLISLLLAVLLILAGFTVFAETAEDDGDDSVQIPVDMPDDDEAESVLELRPLTVGDEGEDVLFLQLRLEDLSYFTGEADGNYGPETQAAVRRFQEDNTARGLEVTGDADISTQILAASAKYRTLRYNSSGEDVKDLQIRLSALGYYTGKISGDYLEGTQNGISNFQKNNGLEKTGVADPLTQEALYAFTAIARYDVPSPTPTPFSDDSWFLVDETESNVPMPELPVMFEKELKRDSKGEAVKKLQERMKLLGYFDGPISGNYQDKTIKAVQRIQTQNGMKATGRTDEATWNLIFNDRGLVMPDQTPKPAPTPEQSPFAITVDVENQIVSVYTRDEEGNYTIPVRQMLCSTGKTGTLSPKGDWVLNGRKARWCYFPKWGDYAQYWTRINASIAFHSPIYTSVSTSALKEASYKALGSRASHGCIRLTVRDAKWIYDNVGAGTVVSIVYGLPKDKELKEALKLPSSPNATPTPAPPEPDYDPKQPPKLKNALAEGSKGDAVYWVQRRLTELGYYTTRCTGSFYNRTAAAVREFQKDHHLYQTGKVNQQTIDAMAEAEKITPTPGPQATPGPQ